MRVEHARSALIDNPVAGQMAQSCFQASAIPKFAYRTLLPVSRRYFGISPVTRYFRNLNQHACLSKETLCLIGGLGETADKVRNASGPLRNMPAFAGHTIERAAFRHSALRLASP
jgi:hypothetical protein